MPAQLGSLHSHTASQRPLGLFDPLYSHDGTTNGGDSPPTGLASQESTMERPKPGKERGGGGWQGWFQGGEGSLLWAPGKVFSPGWGPEPPPPHVRKACVCSEGSPTPTGQVLQPCPEFKLPGGGASRRTWHPSSGQGAGLLLEPLAVVEGQGGDAAAVPAGGSSPACPFWGPFSCGSPSCLSPPVLQSPARPPLSTCPLLQSPSGTCQSSPASQQCPGASSGPAGRSLPTGMPR